MSVLSNSTKQVLQNTSSLSMEIQDDNTIMCNKSMENLIFNYIIHNIKLCISEEARKKYREQWYI